MISEHKFKGGFKKMNKKIKIWKEKKRKKLIKFFKLEGKLLAKAFPGRAAILIKMLKLDEKIISAVYEKPSSKKIGNYVPGTKIPILSDKKLFKIMNKKKHIINLAWHLPLEIKKYLKTKNYRGKVINILENSDYT